MGKHKSWPLRRRPARVDRRPKVLVVCEGKVTEPGYFKAFIQDHEIRLVEVRIVPSAGVPKTVVEFAVQEKKEAQRMARRERDTNRSYDEGCGVSLMWMSTLT